MSTPKYYTIIKHDINLWLNRWASRKSEMGHNQRIIDLSDGTTIRFLLQEEGREAVELVVTDCDKWPADALTAKVNEVLDEAVHRALNAKGMRR